MFFIEISHNSNFILNLLTSLSAYCYYLNNRNFLCNSRTIADKF